MKSQKHLAEHMGGEAQCANRQAQKNLGGCWDGDRDEELDIEHFAAEIEAGDHCLCGFGVVWGFEID